MMRTLATAAAVAFVLATASPATATQDATASATTTGTTTATGTFTAANDTPKPVNDTNPRGTERFNQTGPSGAITGVVQLTGLAPNKAYLAVPYTDGACAPTPGVTAFPSSRFVTDGNGVADAAVTVNPAAVNPAATLDLRNVHSVSVREVAASSSVGPPNVPFPVTEACDTAPVVSTS